MTAQQPLVDLLDYPLMDAIAGRRSRRFGLGMEIPSGPLAHESESDPIPLTEMERAVLVAAGTGVTGWHFGVPFGPDRPDSHAHYSVRYTGRATPSAGGFGTPVLFFTDDNGTYVTNTRDVEPEDTRLFHGRKEEAKQLIDVCRKHTTRLSSERLDVPSKPPHMLPPNLWMANAPGSTLFMPMGDASEQTLALMAIAIGNGTVIVDDEAGRPAGDPKPHIASGMLDEERKMPLSILLESAYEANCLELAFMGHNMVLTMQGMGLGGLYFTGMNRWSVLGAFAEDGIEGLGFRFVDNPDSPMPDPVGIDGVYEGLCPPYYDDMHDAVEEFVDRKFGDSGAYTEGEGALENDDVMTDVEPYSEEFVSYLGSVAQYVYEQKGRFPGTFTTMVLPGYVQAVHLDTDYYDKHYSEGAYLETHADHWEVWHS